MAGVIVGFRMCPYAGDGPVAQRCCNSWVNLGAPANGSRTSARLRSSCRILPDTRALAIAALTTGSRTPHPSIITTRVSTLKIISTPRPSSVLHDELLDLKTQVIKLYLKKRFIRADPTVVRQVLLQAESMERTYDLLLAQYSSLITTWSGRLLAS